MLKYQCLLNLLLIISSVHAFLNPLRVSSFAKAMVSNEMPASSPQANSPMVLESTPKGTFGSRILPVYTDEEIDDLFRELNITRVDLENDPEILKWAPTKEFFERFGFQNATEKSKRRVSDVKVDFYQAYTKPILPQYKTFIADLMTVTFIQIVDARYKYDALHAFGLCTQYYTVMKGYPMQEEVSAS
jgi:hypothetical protein